MLVTMRSHSAVKLVSCRTRLNQASSACAEPQPGTILKHCLVVRRSSVPAGPSDRLLSISTTALGAHTASGMPAATFGDSADVVLGQLPTGIETHWWYVEEQYPGELLRHSLSPSQGRRRLLLMHNACGMVPVLLVLSSLHCLQQCLPDGCRV